MRSTAEDPTATGAETAGTAPGQAASPNGSITAAAPQEPKLEDRLADAERRGVEKGRADGTRAYQGLQRTLSQTQAELAQARADAVKLNMIPALVASQQALLERTLGPEEAQRFALTMENQTLKAQQAAAQQQPVALPNQTFAPVPQQALSPAVEKLAKQQILESWYPGQGLTAEDPNINWASGVADPTEAQRLFHSSVAGVVASKAAEAARQTASQEATRTAQELLTRAGAETTDGALPSGTPAPAVDDTDPKKWNPRDLIARGLAQSGDPHAKLEERQARRVGVGAEGGAVVRTK